ncbi:hypothetical protein BV511_15635 [Methylorubrum extorquens]|uniref:hypothetical protein n=1 Tax=Methylorubrum extorquens TaxID=408 RepID=UPI000972D87D|nr:hypothetical protein [Methylorubrum extorquens]APX86005.1 hypothetical protein BV511_15635 [Methylorubrum extorquens]
MTKSIDRSTILRDAWNRARRAAAASEGVRLHIGAAWSAAKAATMVPQTAQLQQACAAPVRQPWADKWTRISSRAYGDALLGVIAAVEAEFSRAPYRGRGLPVIRVEGERHVFLGWAENEDAAAACGSAWEYRFDVAVRVIGEEGPIAYALLGTGIETDEEPDGFQAPISAADGDGAEVDECDERACSWTVGGAFARWTFDSHNAACAFARLCECLGHVPAFEGKPAPVEQASPAGYRVVKRWTDEPGSSAARPSRSCSPRR